MSPFRSVAVLAAALALALAGLSVASPVGAQVLGPDEVSLVCAHVLAGQQCGAGLGRHSLGGGEKVSHRGWPGVDGVLWKVDDDRGSMLTGTDQADELLGHHGSDVLQGGSGNDILWGDWDPVANAAGQRDVLRGGPGADWIYTSHGTNIVDAGPGNDHVWAYYGHGTIDCGSGYDVVRVQLGGAYRLHGCEVVGHFCAFGPNGHGGCRKPGEARAARRD